MKIVITGALGHIGSYVSRLLPVQFPGVEIIMIDNMMTQRFPSLFNLPSIGKYQFINEDVTKIDLNKIFLNVDVVIHLAAITDASGTVDKAEELEANNFESTKRVAQACLETDTKLITLSSTSVYGTQNKIVSEDCSAEELKPQSPYAITKLKEEEFVSKLFKENGLKVVTCRFGTIYGGSIGMRFHTAVNKFCWQAVMKQPITVWKTAYDQKRPYLDLTDAGNALVYLIKQNIFDGEIYNILTDNLTVRQIVDVISEYTTSLKISFVDNKIMNQLSYEVSCNKFLKKGFVFNGNLRRGIGETISLIQQSNV